MSLKFDSTTKCSPVVITKFSGNGVPLHPRDQPVAIEMGEMYACHTQQGRWEESPAFHPVISIIVLRANETTQGTEILQGDWL